MTNASTSSESQFNVCQHFKGQQRKVKILKFIKRDVGFKKWRNPVLHTQERRRLGRKRSVTFSLTADAEATWDTCVLRLSGRRVLGLPFHLDARWKQAQALTCRGRPGLGPQAGAERVRGWQRWHHSRRVDLDWPPGGARTPSPPQTELQ